MSGPERELLGELSKLAERKCEIAGALSLQNEVLRWAVENKDALRQPLIDSLIARLSQHVRSVTENGALP